ncbi:MAG: hypothetical protein PF495_09740 [Spirochaetales bacterium]|jgi:hypothetical protein|nr:hypothetical protein [Spirochaetales bacterium]
MSKNEENVHPDLNMYMQGLASQLAPLNTPQDLVDLGIFKTLKTAMNQRSNKSGPAYIKKVPGFGLACPRADVLAWVKTKSVYVGGPRR